MTTKHPMCTYDGLPSHTLTTRHFMPWWTNLWRPHSISWETQQIWYETQPNNLRRQHIICTKGSKHNHRFELSNDLWNNHAIIKKTKKQKVRLIKFRIGQYMGYAWKQLIVGRGAYPSTTYLICKHVVVHIAQMPTTTYPCINSKNTQHSFLGIRKFIVSKFTSSIHYTHECMNS